MNRIDPLDIDGRLLGLLVAVVREQSITRAAEQLGLTQSAVSHGLSRLRALCDDPLVVRSGRGVVATARAHELAAQAAEILERLRHLAHGPAFDPARFEGTVQIAANPLQRDLILPALLECLRREAPNIGLRVVPSEVPSAERLRDADCHLVISPRLPEAADIVHTRLFEDRYAVYYDAARRRAPGTLAEFEAAEHVLVRHAPALPLLIDGFLEARGVRRRIGVEVADFSGARAFVRGTDRIATLPSLLRLGALAGLAQAEPPFACEPLRLYALWHQRLQDDPMHRWLRGCLAQATRAALEGLDATQTQSA